MNVKVIEDLTEISWLDFLCRLKICQNYVQTFWGDRPTYAIQCIELRRLRHLKFLIIIYLNLALLENV